MKPLKFTAILLLLILPRISYPQTINHLSISAHDVKKSAKFYTNVIQLKKIPNPFGAADSTLQWFSIGTGIQLHIIKNNGPAEVHHISTHMCFSVASIKDFMGHLDQLNIRYGNWNGDYRKTQLRPDGVTQLYLQDPDGYWIEINDAK